MHIVEIDLLLCKAGNRKGEVEYSFLIVNARLCGSSTSGVNVLQTVPIDDRWQPVKYLVLSSCSSISSSSAG